MIKIIFVFAIALILSSCTPATKPNKTSSDIPISPSSETISEPSSDMVSSEDSSNETSELLTPQQVDISSMWNDVDMISLKSSDMMEKIFYDKVDISANFNLAVPDNDCRFWNASIYIKSNGSYFKVPTTHFVEKLTWLDDNYLLYKLYMGAPRVIDIANKKDISLIEVIGNSEKISESYDYSIDGFTIEISPLYFDEEKYTIDYAIEDGEIKFYK